MRVKRYCFWMKSSNITNFIRILESGHQFSDEAHTSERLGSNNAKNKDACQPYFVMLGSDTTHPLDGPCPSLDMGLRIHADRSREIWCTTLSPISSK